MAGFGTRYGVTRYGWEDEGLGTGAIYLQAGPLTPNSHLTTVPMVWVVGDTTRPADVVNLVVGGLNAVIANVVQAGFTGTCTPNIYGGQTVSIVADLDYWEAEYSIDWTLRAEDGVDVAFFTGTIVKYVTLPYPSPPPTDLEQARYTSVAFPLRFQEDGDTPKVPDDQGVLANIRNAILVLKNGIPLSPAGTMVPLLAFDPAAQVASQLGREARDGVAALEPRVILDPNPVISEREDGSLSALFVYGVDREGYAWREISVPLFRVES